MVEHCALQAFLVTYQISESRLAVGPETKYTMASLFIYLIIVFHTKLFKHHNLSLHRPFRPTGLKMTFLSTRHYSGCGCAAKVLVGSVIWLGGIVTYWIKACQNKEACVSHHVDTYCLVILSEVQLAIPLQESKLYHHE